MFFIRGILRLEIGDNSFLFRKQGLQVAAAAFELSGQQSQLLCFCNEQDGGAGLPDQEIQCQ